MSELEHQATFEAPDPEEVASLFPAYDVHALIACGGMGAVYQATQRSLDRAVAIKILPREFSNDDAFRTGFEAEAKAMAKLNHPNLIGVYDFGEVDGMLFIVMEYVHGKSLFHSVHGRALDEGEALRIVSDVCHGLAHAHEHGVLHRDIKPGNILLDENANPKIGDFGLARALESEIEEGEQIFGTPGYTAPEIIQPPFTFDHRADIFSVGVMLYELLTGNTPDKTEGLPSHLRVSNPRIDTVIQKATQADPASRFSSAKDLASSLEKIASSQNKSLVSGSSPVGAPRPFTQRTLPKKSVSIGTIALLLLAAGAGTILYFVQSQKNQTADVGETPDKPPEKLVIKVQDPAEDPKPVEDKDPEGPVPPEDPVPPTDPEPPKDPEPPNDPGKDFESFNPFESPLVAAKPKEPEEVKPPPPEPKYDVAGFFDRARGIMGDKVAPDIATFKENVKKNTAAFEGKLRFYVSEQYEFARDRLERNLDRQTENWSKNGNMLPQRLARPFRDSPEIQKLHSAFLEEQTNLVERLALKLKLQSDTYVTGIEYQIKRLEGTDDQPAIDLLNEEIEKVRKNDDYFGSLMTEE